MTSYELLKDNMGKFIRRIENDGKISSIPIDEGNSDYQAYLRWLENPEADEAQSL